MKIGTELTVSCSHQLKLPYKSKCTGLHGHNYKIQIELERDELNEEGMLLDFTEIKKLIDKKYDHKNLNEIPPFNELNPTAERMALVISNDLGKVFDGKIKVRVYETEKGWAEIESK